MSPTRSVIISYKRYHYEEKAKDHTHLKIHSVIILNCFDTKLWFFISFVVVLFYSFGYNLCRFWRTRIFHENFQWQYRINQYIFYHVSISKRFFKQCFIHQCKNNTVITAFFIICCYSHPNICSSIFMLFMFKKININEAISMI